MAWQEEHATCSITTFDPMDTADASKAVTTLLSKMFEFDPTLTLPDKIIKI